MSDMIEPIETIAAELHKLPGIGPKTAQRLAYFVASMPLEEVRRNPMTVGIASGDEKVDAILGALRGGIVDLLMTDAITASKVLEANERLLTQNRS